MRRFIEGADRGLTTLFPDCLEAKCLELARAMMRRGTGLDADQARRKLLEEAHNVTTLQLAADDYLPTSINAKNPERLTSPCPDRLS
jgi:hypothetical protein